MKTTVENCQLCLGPHDDEIHDATVNIHIWLRQEIARKIAPWTPNEAIRPSGN
jgi:ABC-type Zn2+ transport system substrate-binding protein/surface adhesin